MYPVLKCVLPTSYTTTENLATFTVELAKGRWPGNHFDRNADMQTLEVTAPGSCSSLVPM